MPVGSAGMRLILELCSWVREDGPVCAGGIGTADGCHLHLLISILGDLGI